MVNVNYIDEDPFIQKYEGLPVESLNLFIMMGGLLEGTIDVNAPEDFRKKGWDREETPQRARFCKFTLANMSGTNNTSTLKFNSGQKAVIKVEIFMQMLDKVEKLNIKGTGLNGLTVNLLKKYPVNSNNDKLIENLDLNNSLVNIMDSQLVDDTFYIELVANGDNVIIENINMMIKTKKLAGDGNLNINGNQIYIDGDRSNTLPIYTKNEFEKLFNKYVKRDLNTVEEATNYLKDQNTPTGAIVLLPKNAFDI